MTWKLQNETISTVGDLGAMPVGSVIAEVGVPNAPAIACKAASGKWHFLGNAPDKQYASEDIYTPLVRLIVLYNPVQEIARLLSQEHHHGD